MDELIREVSKLLDIEESIVRTVVNSYLRSLRKVLTKVTYRGLPSLFSVKTNMIIPGFGKLVVSNGRKLKEQNKYKLDKNGRDKKE